MFWLPTQTGLNKEEMCWLQAWTSGGDTAFMAGFSALHPVWLLAQAADTPDLTLAQNNIQKKRKRGGLFLWLCLLEDVCQKLWQAYLGVS